MIKRMLHPINEMRRVIVKLIFLKRCHCDASLQISPRSLCHVEDGKIEIGEKCLVYGSLYAMDQGVITIGNNTCIFENSFIGSEKSIVIGNCVIISNNVKIYDNNNHPTDPTIRHEMCKKGFFGPEWRWGKSKTEPIVIEDDVWIGERSTILKGVRIGRGSVVACNSVVTKNVPANCIVAGNPARVVKYLGNE